MGNKSVGFSPRPQQQITKAVSVQSVQYSGPIPSADELRKYNEIIPNAADRILSMAEKEQAARLDLQNRAVSIDENDSETERRLLEVNNQNVRCGIICAVLVVLFVLSASVIVAYMNHPIAAGFIGVGGLSSLAAVFIYGAHIKRSEIFTTSQSQDGKEK